MDLVTLALAKSYINKRINEGEIVTGATPQQAAQIERNKIDITNLQTEIESKQPKGNYVKTVNGNKPDASGNVEVATGGSGSGETLTLDTTLTQSGKAADAKAVGDALDKLEEKIPSIDGLAKEEDIPTKPEDIGAQPAGNYLTSAPITSVNGKAGAVVLDAADVGARPDTWVPTVQEVGALPDTYVPPTPTAEQVGADPTGTAASAVSAHNINTDAHNDIRQELAAINAQLTAFFDSDNQTLDELSEIVAYITSNKSLIDAVTTSKVSVADIVNNLTTNMTNKPLSAAQGVAIKALIDGVSGSLVNYQPKGDYVKTINGNKPDASGNVEVTTGDNGSGENVYTFLDAYTAWCKGETFPIAFYGDSTFYGTNTSGEGYTFCDHLQTMLREECGANATVYRVAVAGAHLDSGVNNFDANFGVNGTYADTKMVGIGYGINDRLDYNTYEDYKNGVYSKVETLIQKCFARGIQPFLVTSQATIECGVATSYITQYPLRDANSMNVCANGAKKELAEKYGIPLIDLNKATEEYLIYSNVPADEIISDRLHFGDIGHKYEAGYLFSEIVSRVIPIVGDKKTIISYANQNIRYAPPEDKLRFGGDFKFYARYDKSGNADTKIFDAYVFVKGRPATVKGYKSDTGKKTYARINGVVKAIDSMEVDFGELDLGLHHIEVYTGADVEVSFKGFIFNEKIENESNPVLMDTTDITNADVAFAGMTDAIVPIVLLPEFDQTTKTTSLSGKTVTAINTAFLFTGNLHIGKVDLNEYGTGSLTVVGGKSYAIKHDRYHTIEIEPIELGDNETLAIGMPGDTARPYCHLNPSSLSRIATASLFKSGGASNIGVKVKVYGKS